LLFGLGLGGFFDGIVLHQVLQWHHMVSAWYPITSLHNLELNTRWDGGFHSLTYLLVVGGMVALWRSGYRPAGRDDRRAWLGHLLAGWGLFNIVEGLIDHQLLAFITSTRPCRAISAGYGTWPAFLLWGATMALAGAGGILVRPRHPLAAP
jgi:uncharacterized membrane protein